MSTKTISGVSLDVAVESLAALRTLIKAAAVKDGRLVHVEIVD